MAQEATERYLQKHKSIRIRSDSYATNEEIDYSRLKGEMNTTSCMQASIKAGEFWGGRPASKELLLNHPATGCKMFTAPSVVVAILLTVPGGKG